MAVFGPECKIEARCKDCNVATLLVLDKKGWGLPPGWCFVVRGEALDPTCPSCLKARGK